ncbi:cytochrome C oxidase subunit IV family protein [Azospirillum agricola]|uniref:cytochrome C oxidase subunit IV family protein n=1 Tax=Azospirillum agricola TaxID=1720247 RepID=UPI000A0F371F|nr:cytochrome C oxidase subunit IV family protein [Azospirillum agricola]SMH61939.1 Cytochrome C oxidase subunit IV [Azospirillum lipoferum]
MRIDRLTLSWLILLGLSTVTLLFAQHEESGSGVGIAGAALLLAVAVAKGREILLHYLELDRAGAGWRVLLSGYLVLLCGAILLVHAAGAWGWIGPGAPGGTP